MVKHRLAWYVAFTLCSWIAASLTLYALMLYYWGVPFGTFFADGFELLVVLIVLAGGFMAYNGMGRWIRRPFVYCAALLVSLVLHAFDLSYWGVAPQDYFRLQYGTHLSMIVLVVLGSLAGHGLLVRWLARPKGEKATSHTPAVRWWPETRRMTIVTVILMLAVLLVLGTTIGSLLLRYWEMSK